jgi:copper chaperone
MHVILEIDGMSCGHCVKAVTAALQALPGAEAIAVEVGRASFDAARPPDEATLRALLDDAGYELKSMTASS